MKNTLIKVLSLAMALMMVMGSFVMVTSAATTCDHTTAENATKVGDVEATCRSYGYTLYTCDTCNLEFGIITDTTFAGHQGEEQKLDPTCTTAGYEAYLGCKVCGVAVDEDNQPLDGVRGVDYGKVIPELGHDTRVLLDEAGCEDLKVYFESAWEEADWVLYEKCFREDCDYVNVLKIGNDRDDDGHNYVYTITTEPTCIDPGYAQYACTGCNLKYTGIYVAPNTTYGHDFSEEIAYESECDAEQKGTYTVCAHCGEPEDATKVPTLVEHNWVKLTATDEWCWAQEDGAGINYTQVKDCLNDGWVVMKCTNCDEHFVYEPDGENNLYESDALYTEFKHVGHKLGDVIIKATNAYSHCQVVECTVCGDFDVVISDHVFAITAQSELGTTNKSAVDKLAEATVAPYIKETVAADCLNAGSVTVFCINCMDGEGASRTGATKTFSIPALGHDMTSASATYTCMTAACAGNRDTGAGECADCTHAERRVTCSRCEYSQSIDTEANHVADGVEDKVASTCIENGNIKNGCTGENCAAKVTIEEKLPLDPNNHGNVVILLNTFKPSACGDVNATVNYQCSCGFNGVRVDLSVKANRDIVADAFNKADNKSDLRTMFGMNGTEAFPAHTDARFDGPAHDLVEKYTPASPVAAGKDATGFDHSRVEPTCLTIGRLAYKECCNVNCTYKEFDGEAFTGNDSDPKLVINRVIPTDAKKHVDAGLGAVYAVYNPSTCTTAETVKYYCPCGAVADLAVSVDLAVLTTAGDLYTAMYTNYGFMDWPVAEKKLSDIDTTANGHFTFTLPESYKVSFLDDYSARIETASKTMLADIKNHVIKSTDCVTSNDFRAATCFTAGQHAHNVCSKCNGTFNIASTGCTLLGCEHAANKIAVVIPAVNHANTNYQGTMPGNPETCITDGNKEYKICTYCEGNTEKAEGATKTYREIYVEGLAASNKLTAHGNANWVTTNKVEATCTKDGVNKSVKCTKCNVVYKENVTIDALKADGVATWTFVGNHVIDAYGHNFDNDFAIAFVMVDGVWVDVTGSGIDYNDLCEYPHMTARMCTNNECDGLFTFADFDDDKHVDLDTDADNNNYSDIGWYIFDYVEVQGHSFPENDLAADFKYDEHTAIGHIVGSNVYFADNCTDGKIFYVHCAVCLDKHVVKTLRAPGHYDANGAIVKNCKADTRTCLSCGETNADLGLKDHSMIDAGKAPTCESAGLKLKKCAVCGLEKNLNDTVIKNADGTIPDGINYVEETEVPALGHSVGKYVEDGYQPATYEAAGFYKYICANCGEEQIEEIPILVVNDIKYEITAMNDEGILVVGTRFKVTFTLGTGFSYRALELQIPFINDVRFVEANFLLGADEEDTPIFSAQVEEVPGAPNYVKQVNVLSTYFTADGSNYEIIGDEVPFCELIFEVEAINDYVLNSIAVGYFEGSLITGNSVNNSLTFDNVSADVIELYMLGDTNDDFIIDTTDLMNLAQVAQFNALNSDDEEDIYSVVGDLDLDGDIDIEDLNLLLPYIKTNRTFADYVNFMISITEFEGGVRYANLKEVIDAQDVSKYDFDGDGKYGTPDDVRTFENVVNNLVIYIGTTLDPDEFATVNVHMLVVEIVEFAYDFILV